MKKSISRKMLGLPILAHLDEDLLSTFKGK